MKHTLRTNVIRGAVILGALGFAAGAFVGCDDDGGTVVYSDYAYDDYYLYDAYYPADVAYAGYYWADSWDYANYYWLGTPSTGGTGGAAAGGTGGGGVGGTGGSTTATGGTGGTSNVRFGLVSAIQALARGEQVCPGQATVTERTATPACAGGTNALERSGVTIEFNNCQVQGGGTINGTIDVQSNRTASKQNCDASTVITLGHTTQITNLSFTNANGTKILIPSQTDTGSNNYMFGQNPTMVQIMSDGEVQIFNSAGTMLSDHTFSGNNTYSFSAGTKSYSVDGTTQIQEKNGGAMATLTKNGLTRSGGCCRPTAGSLTVNRTGGLRPGESTWTFGPSCGTVQRNNVSVMLPACY